MPEHIPGALGAEIWVNMLPVGLPTPTDPASFMFVALDPGHEYASRTGTRTRYTLDFDCPDGRQERTLHAALGEHEGREGAVKREGHSGGWGVRR